MKRRLSLLLFSTGAVGLIAPEAAAQDDGAATAAVERFLSCYEAEGGVVDDEVRALVESLGPDLAGGWEGSGAAAPAAFADADCGDLAEAWTPVVTPDVAPPAWALQIAESAAERAIACYAELEGRAPTDSEVAALQAYRNTMAQGLASVAHAMGAQPEPDAVAPCAEAMRSTECEALAAGLSPSGELSLGGGAETCAALFGIDASGGGLADAPELEDVRGLEDFIEPTE